LKSYFKKKTALDALMWRDVSF